MENKKSEENKWKK